MLSHAMSSQVDDFEITKYEVLTVILKEPSSYPGEWGITLVEPPIFIPR